MLDIFGAIGAIGTTGWVWWLVCGCWVGWLLGWGFSKLFERNSAVYFASKPRASEQAAVTDAQATPRPATNEGAA
jgi:hypothetical protein